METCDRCGVGTLVRRNGPYGAFLGCDQFPRCRGSKPLGESNDSDMQRVVEWYGAREEDPDDADYYDIDPDQEDREIERRERAYEKWLDRT